MTGQFRPQVVGEAPLAAVAIALAAATGGIYALIQRIDDSRDADLAGLAGQPITAASPAGFSPALRDATARRAAQDKTGKCHVVRRFPED